MWYGCPKSQWHLRKQIKSLVSMQWWGLDRIPWEFFWGSIFGRGFESIKAPELQPGVSQWDWWAEHGLIQRPCPMPIWTPMTPPASTPALARAKVHHWGVSIPETQFEFRLNGEKNTQLVIGNSLSQGLSTVPGTWLGLAPLAYGD